LKAEGGLSKSSQYAGFQAEAAKTRWVLLHGLLFCKRIRLPTRVELAGVGLGRVHSGAAFSKNLEIWSKT
jgi:hypothetical protein